MRSAYLLLEDGAWFPGTTRRPFAPTTGEAVFTTNLTGWHRKKQTGDHFQPGGHVATMDANARLGLGLVICKRLVEAQKGKIWIESDPGKVNAGLLLTSGSQIIK